MTAVVALVHNGVVHLGGDSAGTNGWNYQTIRKDPKVFVKDKYAFGFCGSFRMGQILHYRFSAPKMHEDEDPLEFMSTRFVDGVREILKDYGFAEVKNAVEKGGSFLVGYRGEIYEIASDYQVGVAEDPYTAIGSGESFAKGSLYTTKDLDLDPETKLTTALEAAARFQACVAPPFNFVSIG